MTEPVAFLGAIILALLLDRWLGEPAKFHPLVGFGWLVVKIEGLLRSDQQRANNRLKGLLAWLLLVVPLTGLSVLLLHFLPPFLSWLVGSFLLYLTIGLESLKDHANKVLQPLQGNDLPAAREAVSRIVSRDTDDLNEQQAVAATVETVLENGSDAVFAPLFWFLVAGAPGAVAYRVINTLDAMWGYRNSRYGNFGFVAAKMDDIANWIPARLSAFSYCLMGDFGKGWRAMVEQGPQTDSPNAGRVMAAGSGALGVQVGGATMHGGQQYWRPVFGFGAAATTADITAAIALLNRAVLLWVLVAVLVGGLYVFV